MGEGLHSHTILCGSRTTWHFHRIWDIRTAIQDVIADRVIGIWTEKHVGGINHGRNEVMKSNDRWAPRSQGRMLGPNNMIRLAWISGGNEQHDDVHVALN